MPFSWVILYYVFPFYSKSAQMEILVGDHLVVLIRVGALVEVKALLEAVNRLVGALALGAQVGRKEEEVDKDLEGAVSLGQEQEIRD